MNNWLNVTVRVVALPGHSIISDEISGGDLGVLIAQDDNPSFNIIVDDDVVRDLLECMFTDRMHAAPFGYGTRWGLEVVSS